MIGTMFSGASDTWEIGYSAAEGASGVRSVLGTVERELAQAIDGRDYGLDEPIEVSGNTITFCRYAETTSNKSKKDKKVQTIKYTFKRNSVSRSQDGSQTILYSKPESVDGNSDVNVDFDIGYIPIDKDNLNLNEGLDEFAWTISSVWVRARVYRTSTFAGMEARSLGPDGDINTDDDIIVR